MGLKHDPLTGKVLEALREIRAMISANESLPEHRTLNHEIVYPVYKSIFELYTGSSLDNIG